MMFENTLKYKSKAIELENEWNEWRKEDVCADGSLKGFEDLCQKHDKLAEQIAKAYYKDTQEYNSWDTIRQCFLKKGQSGTVSLEPLHLINQCEKWSKE
jgi:hypothetical protein